MNAVLIGAMMVLTVVQQTDTTFAVGDASEFHLENMGGEIQVNTWDRDEVRVQAEHSRRSVIEIRRRTNRIHVEADAVRGVMAGVVDFVITVPRSMGLYLEGLQTDITVEGSEGDIEAETVQGDITIRGGRGSVSASSATGAIRVEGAEGTIEVSGMANEIRLVDISGDIFAESVGSSIIIEDSNATSVDASTVGGRISYTGPIMSGGDYFFGSHGGTINILVPRSTNAEFSLSSLYGHISIDLPGAPESFERGERTTFTAGSGGAVVEAETFGGRITIRSRGPGGGEAPRR